MQDLHAWKYKDGCCPITYGTQEYGYHHACMPESLTCLPDQVASATQAADVGIMRTEAASNDDLWEENDATDDTALATIVQASLFGDNMETNAWDWSMYLDLSPVNDQSLPDNVS
jgi:hypothetical protein